MDVAKPLSLCAGNLCGDGSSLLAQILPTEYLWALAPPPLPVVLRERDSHLLSVPYRAK